jgi:hypothetical protein
MKNQSNMKPILFSTPMVQAILDGKKTQTRRIMKPQPSSADETGIWYKMKSGGESLDCFPQPVRVGDVLYVRETFAACETPFGDYLYKADYQTASKADLDIKKWSPSLHMPTDAARIFLRITAVKTERLQDISEQDAIKEGIERVGSYHNTEGGAGMNLYENYLAKGNNQLLPFDSFKTLWQSINGPESWNQNPWVWAYTFERCERPQSEIVNPKSAIL